MGRGQVRCFGTSTSSDWDEGLQNAACGRLIEGAMRYCSIKQDMKTQVWLASTLQVCG